MSRPRLTAADNAEMMADSQALGATEAVVADAPVEGDAPAAEHAAEPTAAAASADPANAAEPANDTGTTADAPADAPQATQEPTPGKSVAERLAAIKKAQQRAVAERRAIAEERAQVQAMREQVEREVASLRETIEREAQAMREKALADVTPLAKARELLASDSAEQRLEGLKALGFSYEDTTQMFLAGGNLTPQQIEAKLRKEYDDKLKSQQAEILKAIEEREERARAEREKTEGESRRAAARNAAISHASTLVSADSHPMTQGLIDDGEYTREEIGEAIVKTIEADYEQRYKAALAQGYTDAQIRQGLRPLDYSDAYGMLEASLESDFARLEKARQRKLASRTPPDASKPDAEGNAPAAASQSKPNQTPGHPTLTSSESTTVASKKAPRSMREVRQQVYQETPVLLASSGRR